MPEPCKSCIDRDRDWGGCRCQAYAVARDAAAPDPTCERSKDNPRMLDLVNDFRPAPPFIYRAPPAG